MDFFDKYAEQLRRQNLGYTCEYCDSAAGHRVSCVLLSTTPRVMTSTASPSMAGRSTPPLQSRKPSLVVNKYYRKGLTKEPTQAEHSLLSSMGIAWEGDNR